MSKRQFATRKLGTAPWSALPRQNRLYQWLGAPEGATGYFDFTNLSGLPSGVITYTRASSAQDFNDPSLTYGTNVPVLNSSGLLLQGARTNSIRNGNATGSTNGVVGSGGAFPTNWGNNLATGLTNEIVGSGTINGVSYVDVRISGTVTAGPHSIRLDANNQIAALSGQTWTASVYVAMIAGSMANISSTRVEIVENNGSGGFLASSNQTIALTSSLQRVVVTRTFNNASTAFANMNFGLGGLTTSGAVDITLRIGSGQLELGSFASSYIPTTGTTATRANDIASILNLASLGYNTAQGTMMAEFSTLGQPTAGTVFAFTDNTVSNLINLRRAAGTPANILYDVQNGGAGQVTDTFTAVNALQTYRAAVAWQDNNFASVLTGYSLINDNTGTVPTTVDRLLLGRRNNGGAVDFGFLYLRRLVYYPTRLPDAQLTAMVA